MNPAARSAGVLALTMLLACKAPPPDPLVAASEDGASRALAYLSSTSELVTIDAVISMMVYAEVTDDRLAASQAERRLRLVPDDAINAFGVALGREHPAYEASVLPEIDLDAGDIPDPRMTLDDRDQTCPLAALSCESVPECDEYLSLSLWGYPLTHQALALAFAQWGGCENDDLALRQRIGGRLRHAQRANPGPSDLSSERIAMLGQLGFSEAIDDAWIDELLGSQAPDGSFYWEEGGEAHPHPTGVAVVGAGELASRELNHPRLTSSSDSATLAMHVAGCCVHEPKTASFFTRRRARLFPRSRPSSLS